MGSVGGPAAPRLAYSRAWAASRCDGCRPLREPIPEGDSSSFARNRLSARSRPLSETGSKLFVHRVAGVLPQLGQHRPDRPGLGLGFNVGD